MKKHELEGKFNPKEFEDEIYDTWEKNGYFRPNENNKKGNYCIVMPPPNVTGKLHMGHALDQTLQDLFIRYKRMKGYNTLWIPGTDHSALSTEAKVVAMLKEEGTSKKEIGREKFLERSWEWKEKYGNIITSQIRKLGSSCDWEHERFTMDEGLSHAVYTAFERLYNKGYIYKGKRMINWCTGCKTSISDAEIEHTQEPTHLWYLRYKIKDSDESIIVATTRPETMLGDTAVTVNPKDERYKDVIGKKVILPIVHREIPIVADEFVEMDFGTGAVKVTPAHDPNDYESGLRHNLPVIEVFDENNKMLDLVPQLEGMDIYEARDKVVEMLKNENALIKIEDYTHNVARCDRCHSIIEPRISDQWFVKMSELAKPAIQAVKDGDVVFEPKRYEKTFFNWMENIRDWCISRQIWWGHQIPVYYCDDCGEVVVSEKMPDVCPKCGKSHFTQDPDTLDTWFSSALWPFSTLGWPDDTKELNTFYPTNTLVTGYDIIQSWVSRMIFSGLEYMEKKPFDTVFIHGIVRDSQGRKMSKSLGNGIDPLEIIDKYGTDSLRFSLVLGITPGNDIRYMPEKLDSSSNFANKIWNAAKFVLSQVQEEEDTTYLYEKEIPDSILENATYEDKWILSKLNKLILEVTQNIDNFDIGVATQKIYEFLWNEFCDWYIEMVKPRLYNKEDKTTKAAKWTLNHVLVDSLKLLHPIMPFITEKIFDCLYTNEESIMISSYPEQNSKYSFEKEEEAIQQMKKIISQIRNIRISRNVHPSKKVNVIIVTDKYEKCVLSSNVMLEKLMMASSIELKKDEKDIPQNAISILENGIKVFLPFEELVDINEEKQRLESEKEKLEKEVERASKMLSNPGFVAKAPQSKIQEEKEKLEKYKNMLSDVIKGLENLK